MLYNSTYSFPYPLGPVIKRAEVHCFRCRHCHRGSSHGRGGNIRQYFFFFLLSKTIMRVCYWSVLTTPMQISLCWWSGYQSDFTPFRPTVGTWWRARVQQSDGLWPTRGAVSKTSIRANSSELFPRWVQWDPPLLFFTVFFNIFWAGFILIF